MDGEGYLRESGRREEREGLARAEAPEIMGTPTAAPMAVAVAEVVVAVAVAVAVGPGTR
jgi:hypothetical protein